jgi:ketosteroid isomerase-like protein
MTAEQVIEAICAAVAAGELDWAVEHVAADGVFHGTIGGLDEGEVMHGPDAVMRYFHDVAATWDEWRIEPEEVRRNGDTFVVFWHETCRSHEIEMHSETAMLFKLRGGKVVEARGYLDRDAALEAAGIG